MNHHLWIESTDANGMLLDISGWHIGSYAALEAKAAIEYALDRKWIQERTHHFPNGDTSRAYELTDGGLDRIGQVYGQTAKQKAKAARQWYRDRAGDY